MSVYKTLEDLGISLPAVAPPVASFVPFVRSGRLIFLSGHIAKAAGRPLAGKLGADLSTEQGRAAARAVAVDLLATLHEATGSLDTISRIVKLTVLPEQGFTFPQTVD